MWRVFWVPLDAVRAGIRRRVLAGWKDLPAREDRIGVRAGDPIFLSPDYRVDPILGLYVHSAGFQGYTAETRRNYATDIALLLTFLWGRGRSWADAVERDLEDYEHWRRFAAGNPNRVGGSKWDRELAAFTSLYGWAGRTGPADLRPPRSLKQGEACSPQRLGDGGVLGHDCPAGARLSGTKNPHVVPLQLKTGTLGRYVRQSGTAQ
jgi:hypothetical protein